MASHPRFGTVGYVVALTALAVGVTALLVVLAPPGDLDAVPLLIAVVAIAVAEVTEVDFRWDRIDGSFTLTEVATAAALFLLPPAQVALAIVPAMLLARITLWRTPVKVLYNVVSPLLGTGLAGLVLIATPVVGPTIEGRPVLGVVLGMILHGGATVLMFAGLLARVQDRLTAAGLGRQLPMHLALIIGTTSVGVVTAALWESQPELVPFVLALAAAVHLAQRSSVRAASLLTAQEAEHDRLVRVVDGASDGIVLLDADGRVQVWNPAMARLLGSPVDQATGRTIGALLADRRHGDLHGSGWDLTTADPSQPQREEEARVDGPDGAARDVRESHAFTFDDRGRCTGSVVVVRDVSRQRELERLRSDFVARVSHELRTPLTPIRGFASVLLRRGDDLEPTDRREILERLAERTEHLHALVEDLLLVTQLDRPEHRQLVGLEPTDVRGPVEEAVDATRAAAPHRLITLTGAAEELPAVPADPDRVAKIVGILLDNADRYSPDELPIEVEVAATPDHVEVRVIDHGPGIARRHRELIFERFSRLEDPMTMRTGGVGVGLFLGRRLAESMHGSLRLEDPRGGHGACFALRIPLRGGAAASDDDHRVASRTAATAPGR